jgi:hypothetical protein
MYRDGTAILVCRSAVVNWWGNGPLLAAAPDLLHELKLANKIIINALNIMTEDQKREWDEANTRDDLKDGWALTRNHSREVAIAKAEGGLVNNE